MWCKTIAAAACVAALAGGAQASLVNYVEANDGDLSDNIFAPDVFALDTVGINSWSGTGESTGVQSNGDIDRFEVNLATGLKIVAYSMSVGNFVHFPDSDLVSANGWIQITAQDRIARYATHKYGDLGLTVTNPVPLPWTDPLAVRVDYVMGNATHYTFDWQLTLTTAPINQAVVPLPAGLPLLGAGLAMLAGLRLRRRAKP